jgi:hypothetical protein
MARVLTSRGGHGKLGEGPGWRRVWEKPRVLIGAIDLDEVTQDLLVVVLGRDLIM